MWDMFMMEQYSLLRYNSLHECEFVSVCCGATEHHRIDSICSDCYDQTTFECSIEGCEKN